MPNICVTCNHPERIEIDRQLISGKSVTKIARKYGLNPNAVYNHKQNHLSHQLVTAMEKKQLAENFNLLDKIDDLLSKSQAIFDRNYRRKRDNVALKALAEQRQTLELLSKISFALHEVKRLEAEQSAEADQYEQELQIQNDLSVFTLPELTMFNLLSQKLESQDKNMVVIPENKRLYSNPHLGHSHNPADKMPDLDSPTNIQDEEMPNTAKFSDNARPKKRFVRTRPRITDD